MANTSAFQAEDAGSIPVIPSTKHYSGDLRLSWEVFLGGVSLFPCCTPITQHFILRRPAQLVPYLHQRKAQQIMPTPPRGLLNLRRTLRPAAHSCWSHCRVYLGWPAGCHACTEKSSCFSNSLVSSSSHQPFQVTVPRSRVRERGYGIPPFPPPRVTPVTCRTGQCNPPQRPCVSQWSSDQSPGGPAKEAA